jgi:hypothetical protein
MLGVLFAMIVVVFWAAAASAIAESAPNVYGQATMQPLVSIQVSGTGSNSGNPLVFVGQRGQSVTPEGGGNITLTNDGDVPVSISVGHAFSPADGLGSVWTYTVGGPGPNSCVWVFSIPMEGNATVKESGVTPTMVLTPNLAAGDSRTVYSAFAFPTVLGSGNAHVMAAVFWAEAL